MITINGHTFILFWASFEPGEYYIDLFQPEPTGRPLFGLNLVRIESFGIWIFTLEVLFVRVLKFKFPIKDGDE